MSLSIVPMVDASSVAEYYMHRCQLYDALGMREQCRADLKQMLATDPTFASRYHDKAQAFEERGHMEEAKRIREFLLKLYI